MLQIMAHCGALPRYASPTRTFKATTAALAGYGIGAQCQGGGAIVY
jgi:hypothetical protein